MKLMGGKIKKFFLNFKRFNKPAVLAAVFFFVFLGLALPSQFAQAGFLDVLASIPVMIITLLLQVVLAISNLILGLSGLILGWVTGPYFTTLPYTHGGIVEIGWQIVRDFINMFFVIALVIIGLSTALRIKEYQAQKALPRLIIIAILINFTPVICGLIIDASNILMNFFLKELTGFQLMRNFFAMQGSAVWEAFSHPFDFRYAVTALGKTIVMIIFSLGIPKVFWGAAYIFFMYSLLFIMRYVMLWALVIVSPIAFFSKIFPGSQKHLFKSILGWDEWWKQFIEWSLLGVIAGFFLYLAEQLMMLAPGMISGLPPGQGGGWVGNPIVEFVNNFLPWLVVLVFLWLGYKITKDISAMGAQGLMKTVDTGIKMVATAAITAATLGAGAAAGAGLIGKAAAGARRMEAFVGKVPIAGKPLKYGIAKPISWATRGMERFVGEPLEKYAAEKRRVEVPPEFEKLPVKEQVERYHKAITVAEPYRKAGMLKGIIESGNWDKAVEEGLITKEDMKDVRKLGKMAWGRGEKTIARALPDIFTKEIYPEMWNEGEQTIKEGEVKKEGAEVKFEEALETEKKLRRTRKPGRRRRLQNEINRLENEATTLEREGGELIEKGKTLQSSTISKLLEGTKTGEIKNMSESSLKVPAIKKAIVDTFTGSQMGEIGRNFDRHIVEGIQKEIQATPIEILVKKNPNLTLWLETNAAQGLGFSLPKEAAEFPREIIRRLVREARVESEEDRRVQKGMLEPEGPMLLRKYYRKDTSDKIKSLIEEITMERGKTIPPTPELEKRIGKFEKEFDKLTEQLRDLYQSMGKAEREFNRLSKMPGVTPADIAVAKTEMDRVKMAWSTGSAKIVNAQKKLETQEKDALKDLW
jgi:hypothetical protein